MSKLAGYSPEDQEIIRQLMPLLIEVQVNSGVIAESDAAIKAAMPAAFDDVVVVVEKLTKELARFPRADAATLLRIKTLTLKLLAGRVQKSRGTFDRSSLLSWLAQAFEDARQVSTAVDEYLCG